MKEKTIYKRKFEEKIEIDSVIDTAMAKIARGWGGPGPDNYDDVIKAFEEALTFIATNCANSIEHLEEKLKTDDNPIYKKQISRLERMYDNKLAAYSNY